MAVQGDAGSKEEIKTQFNTIDGVYKLSPVSEYSRPNRTTYNSSSGCALLPPVKLSFISVPENSNVNSVGNEGQKVCYNHGRDLCVYAYKGVAKAPDLTKPIEKRSYNKEEMPMCHDFGYCRESDRLYLLVGLFGGQVQLFDPVTKEINKSFNAGERLIDRSKVTCIRWKPNSTQHFLVSHSSGHLYVYNEELGCTLERPVYQQVKQGENYTVSASKCKNSKNPLYKWSIGEGSINEFAFSACSKYLATVSQDGYLRVFIYETMELIGSARSYYGGMLCLCWSPDSKYIVTGGEDDLITIWSFSDKKVVARGQGHKSWVTVVAFDKYRTVYPDMKHSNNIIKEDLQLVNGKSDSSASSSIDSLNSSGFNCSGTSYRVGSVGQDTLLCLWDLKEDCLEHQYFRPRSSTLFNSTKKNSEKHENKSSHGTETKVNNLTNHSAHSFTTRLVNLNFGEKKSDKDHKLTGALKSSSNSKSSNSKNQVGNLSQCPKTLKSYGTPQCPRLDECPVIEPMLCKKISYERISGLVFREDCIVTSCQDGCIYTWCRPGVQIAHPHHSNCSPTVPIARLPSSSGGTVV